MLILGGYFAFGGYTQICILDSTHWILILNYPKIALSSISLLQQCWVSELCMWLFKNPKNISAEEAVSSRWLSHSFLVFSLLLIYFLHSIKNGIYRSRSIKIISFAKKKKTTKQQLKNNSKILSAFVDCAVYQRFTFFTSVALPL